METAGARSADAAVPAAAAPALAAAHVSKAFPLPHRQADNELLQALDDVSLTVARGEFIGIVGRNGSGKSTLLKCLAGIYGLDAGSVAVGGRLSPFLELGVGFTPDLTARDNIMINGTILGLSRREVRARTPAVLEFAELEEFADLPLKNFSSGMKVRLAFAIAIQVDAEILLFDEVLAVGDAAFKEKCFAEFERMRGHKTIVLVTHDMEMVERFCDRAVLLERGQVIADGPPEVVSERYLQVNEEHEGPRTVPRAGRRGRRATRGTHELTDGRDELRRLLHVTATLASTALKLRFAGSQLGLFWSVLRPLLLFGVLYAVFTQVVRFGDDVRHYELYLLSGIVLWTCFSDATGGAVGSLVARASIMRKLRFPRLAVPLAVVAAAFVDLAVNLLVLFAFAVALGVEPRLSWLGLVPVVLLLGLLATGVAVLLSALFVRKRDIGPVWTVLQRGLFYGSAVLYPVAAFPDSVERLMLLANPIVPLLTEARHALIGGDAPSAAVAAGGAELLLVPLAVTALICALALWVFEREAPRMTENL